MWLWSQRLCTFGFRVNIVLLPESIAEVDLLLRSCCVSGFPLSPQLPAFVCLSVTLSVCFCLFCVYVHGCMYVHACALMCSETEEVQYFKSTLGLPFKWLQSCLLDGTPSLGTVGLSACELVAVLLLMSQDICLNC